MPECLECGKPFERKRPEGRTPKFCSRKCYEKKYYRHPDDTGAEDRNRTCIRCGTPFVQSKRHQRFCSRGCYEGGWQVEHRELHNARQRKKRADDPEWFREHEPKYAKTYRAKSLSKKPWKYLLQSRRLDAEKRGLVFTLTDEWAAERWDNRCEVTGLVFRQNKSRGPWPFSPSIDRINNRKGYTPDNCRFVIWGVNALKGVGTDKDMYTIALVIAAKISHTDS